MRYHASSAIIIREKDNKVFVTKRGKNKKLAPGKWEMVGGAIETGENPEECLRREIKEELNADVKSFEYFKNYIYNGCDFEVFIVELEEKPRPNKIDFEDWGWFAQNEIEKMDFAINCKGRMVDYFESKR